MGFCCCSDLKPANVLLDRDKVKVADFGLCRVGLHTTRRESRSVFQGKHQLDGNSTSQDGSGEDNHDTPGTVEYMAPEVYEGHSIGTAADVYSFGIMLWEMMTRRRPMVGFPKPICQQQLPAAAVMLLHWVATENLRPAIPADRYCPEQWQDIMKRCWAPRPRDRPKFTSVLQSLQKMQADCENWLPAISKEKQVLSVPSVDKGCVGSPELEPEASRQLSSKHGTTAETNQSASKQSATATNKEQRDSRSFGLLFALRWGWRSICTMFLVAVVVRLMRKRGLRLVKSLRK